MAIVKVTKEMAERAVAEIDWDKVDAMTDADIERQIAENPDAAPDMAARAAQRVWQSDRPLAERLAGARKALGLSRPQFAEAYGIPFRTLEGWEQGLRQPDRGTTAYLATIFAMPHRVAETVAIETRRRAS
ncbi:MAG TPA: helix-turn-helix domain-containing protein [Stellaceae bacterium]|nr:helix-turn-helix domain-containing protein [Stellaceae bacterium]